MAPRLAPLALLLAVVVSSAEGTIAVRGGLATRGASAAAARSKGAGKDRSRHSHSEAVGDANPTCSCDCCDVQSRRPDESIGLARVKCTPADGHSADVCGAQCTPDQEDRVLRTVTVDNVLDYSRFCFFECKPAQGLESPPATQCLPLEESDIKRVVDAGGNARDPAIVYGHNGRASDDDEHGSPRAALLANKAPNPQVQAAVDATEKGRSQSKVEEKGARQFAEQAREREEQEQEELGDELRGGPPGGLDPYAVVADLHQSAQRGKAMAQRASQAAQEAVKAYKAARLANWQAGLTAAEGAVQEMRQEAADKAYAEAHPPPTWASKATAAAAKKDGPYLDAVRAGEDSAAQWNALGFQTAKQANALDAEARSLAATANALARSGQAAAAQAKLEEAREVATKAQEYSVAARKMFGTAVAAGTSAKIYYGIAAEAAAQAGAAMPSS